MIRGITYIAVALTAFLTTAPPVHAGERIICASTTSTQNSGLFEHILPVFEAGTGIKVHVLAVGTGAALEIGRRGDADVVMVHARELEFEAVKAGYFVNRRDLMYNGFVIIGPEDDPAGLRGSTSAREAMGNIAKYDHLFVSRGDNSGTHRREMKLWAEAGVDPKGKAWYMEVGQGMARTQRVANEKRAYTLTDRGTWLSRKDALDMAVVFDEDPALLNQYGVMAVNPERHPHVKHREATAFIEWLVSEEGQRAIGSYRVNGRALFVPNAW
jgi:tungstate transport system substrate-binding protein